MNKIILLLLVLFPPRLHAQGYWQQQTDFRIDVSLNDVDHSLDGFEKIVYRNNSPDTLQFIWIQLPANAFRNDRSFYSEQRLQNGKTDFYFSDRESRGYINRLSFRANGQLLAVKDHPLYIDLVMLILSKPLKPNESVTITTPFHVQLPKLVSGFGHDGQFYLLSKWYPRPAVYDKQGWHPEPVADQGNGYNEIGNYDVSIQLPLNYQVAASGNLVEEDSISGNSSRLPGAAAEINPASKRKTNATKQKGFFSAPSKTFKQPGPLDFPASDNRLKTLHYEQHDITQFTWIADKRLKILNSIISLEKNKEIKSSLFYLPGDEKTASAQMDFIQASIRFRTEVLGEYPFNRIIVVFVPHTTHDFPVVQLINSSPGASTESTTEQAIGLNWFSGGMSVDEDHFNWIVSGLNRYYDRRFFNSSYYTNRQEKEQAPGSGNKNGIFPSGKPPDFRDQFKLAILSSEHLDQPIATPTDSLNWKNFKLVPAAKSASWFSNWQDSLGASVFDRRIRAFVSQWQFKHPYAEDLANALNEGNGSAYETHWQDLHQHGPAAANAFPRGWNSAYTNASFTINRKYAVGILPAVGFNDYDHMMIGIIVHNLVLPSRPFQFMLAPLYATASKQLNGTGTLCYSWFPENTPVRKFTAGVSGARFSSLSGTDSNQHKIFGGFYTLVPYLRAVFNNKDFRNTQVSWLEWKTFLIGEKNFNYTFSSTDSQFFPSAKPYDFRYLNQLTFGIENNRKLYPYDVDMQVQQASAFYRINVTGHYFFNYGETGGMQVRLFAAKFGYLGGYSTLKEAQTFYYQPKLTAVRGDEDYTYSNYFIGRNEQSGLASQQIMMRDGGLKIRTDLFEDLQGRSDNWVASLNFSSSLPKQLVPEFIPLKLFLDLGTYAGGWTSNPETSKFLFVSGIQLSLFKNSLNIYAPIFYSSDFRDQLKTVPSENKFWNKISFSFDLQNIRFRKFAGNSFAL